MSSVDAFVNWTATFGGRETETERERERESGREKFGSHGHLQSIIGGKNVFISRYHTNHIWSVDMIVVCGMQSCM